MSIRTELRDAEREAAKAIENGARAVNESFPEIQEIKKNVLGLAHNIKETSAEKAHEASGYMQDRMDDAMDSGADTLEKLERRIKAKPGQSIAIAFAAGILANFLLGRR